MQASENDYPKIQEILKAGANPAAKDPQGRTPTDLAPKSEVKELLAEFSKKTAGAV